MNFAFPLSGWGKRKLSSKVKPAVKAFQTERAFPARCFLCIDEEAGGWVHDCLAETIKAKMPRPLGSRVHRELVDAFGQERCAWSDSSTRRHLRDHEPLWRKWDEQKG